MGKDDNKSGSNGAGVKVLVGLGAGLVTVVGGILSAVAASSVIEAGSRSSAMDAALKENNSR